MLTLIHIVLHGFLKEGRLGDVKLYPTVLLVDSFISDQFPVTDWPLLYWSLETVNISLHYWQNIRGIDMLLKKVTVLGEGCIYNYNRDIAC